MRYGAIPCITYTYSNGIIFTCGPNVTRNQISLKYVLHSILATRLKTHVSMRAHIRQIIQIQNYKKSFQNELSYQMEGVVGDVTSNRFISALFLFRHIIVFSTTNYRITYASKAYTAVSFVCDDI